MLEKTLLDEFVKLTKLPIWKTASLLGDPDAPSFLAERVVIDKGQNHPESGDGQFGRRPVEGGVKKSPFEPLSIIPLKVPLRLVMMSPNGSVLYAVTPEGTLLVFVPIPSTRIPLTECEPVVGTVGSSTTTPLLSGLGRSATGFCT